MENLFQQLTHWSKTKEEISFAEEQLKKYGDTSYEWRQNEAGLWAIFVSTMDKASGYERNQFKSIVPFQNVVWRGKQD